MIEETQNVLSVVSSIADILVACATCFGLWYAFRQYEAIKTDQAERQREHRLSVAQDAIRQMHADGMARFAATTLDWAVGIVPVPHDWRDVVGQAGPEIDVDLLEEALCPDISARIAKDPLGLLYRNAFVRLFNHLEAMYDLRTRGVVRDDDLDAVKWITQQLDLWTYATGKRRPKEDFFKAAIRKWYPGKDLWALAPGSH